MFQRMLRSLAIPVVALSFMLEPAVAAPPTFNIPAPVTATQTDFVLIGARRCTARVRTDCLESRVSGRKTNKSRRQAQADARAAEAVAASVLFIFGAAIASSGGYRSRNHSYRGRDNYRSGYYRRGGGGCVNYDTPNPYSGRC